MLLGSTLSAYMFYKVYENVCAIPTLFGSGPSKVVYGSQGVLVPPSPTLSNKVMDSSGLTVRACKGGARNQRCASSRLNLGPVAVLPASGVHPDTNEG